MEMIMRKHIILLSTISLLLASCGGFIRDEFTQMQHEIDELRTRIDALNGSVESVHTIVTEMAEGGYVKSFTELSEGGRTGYELTFNNGKTVKLFNGVTGKDGKDAEVPQLGIKQDSDGIWYWTLDGGWLDDGSGQKVRAAEKDGIVPGFKVDEGKISISLDNGNTWNEVGVARDIDGLSIVSYTDIASFKDRIILTLADGTKVEIPRYQPILVTLSLSGEENGISAGETIPIGYTLTGNVSENTLVTAGTDGKYKTHIERISDSEGTILVTCPNLYSDGYIYVMVNDGEGHSSVKVVTFYKREMQVSDGFNFDVDCTGGTVEIPWTANFDYNLVCVDGAEEWIHVIATRAEMKSGTIRLKIDPNPYDEVRTGVVEIRPADNPEYAFERIVITEASAYFTIDNSHVTAPSAGGEYVCQISSSRGVSLLIPSGIDSWISHKLDQTGDYSYRLTLTVGKNRTDDRRNTTIKIMTGDGKYEQGSVTVVQLPEVIDHEKDLVMTVRANDIFDWTVYLPLRGRMDCYVDWGDGNVELVEKDVWEERLSHKYNVSTPKTFTVSISGTARALNTEGMPNKGAILSVEQWGDLDLHEAYNAFQECTQLSSIPDDKLGAFADVDNFSSAFHKCVSLKQIPRGLFRHAPNARNFDWTFSETPINSIPEGLFDYSAKNASFNFTFSRCERLVTIPENLFYNCVESDSFRAAFQTCAILTVIPENLFSKCIKAKVFESTFSECFALKEIPAGLFSKNEEVEFFSNCFSGCHSLIRIPVGLFDKNRRVTRFSRCFSECYHWKGESPYTMINGKKVHLYDRFDYPDMFVTPVETESCFSDCNELIDIEVIPEYWR
jgi:hypothetical protein